MRVASIIAAGTALLSAAVSAADINVISTQATQEAYLELAAQFEKASGHKVKTVFNGTLNVQKRLADGEPYDLIVMERMTTFSAGIHSGARERDAAKALVKFLTAPAAAPVVRKHGLEPA